MRSKSHSISVSDSSCLESSVMDRNFNRYLNDESETSNLNVVFGQGGDPSLKKAQSSIKSGFDDSAFSMVQDNIVGARKKSHCPCKKMHLYIQMEYCSGQSLSQILRRHPLQRLDTYILFVQLLRGVSYIHKKGIIHRDLKYAICDIGQTTYSWMIKATSRSEISVSRHWDNKTCY